MLLVDDFPSINAALIAAQSANDGVQFSPITYTTAPISISPDNANVPRFIDFNGATLVAVSGSSGPLFSVTKPHEVAVGGFSIFGGVTIDANNLCNIGLLVNGMMRGSIRDVTVINSSGSGFKFLGEPGFGIYYNEFANLQSGLNGKCNVGNGFLISCDSASGYYVGANTFSNCRAHFNKGHGFYTYFSNNTFIAPCSEKNDLNGFNFGQSLSNTILGGYSEANHQMFATNGCRDNTPDISFNAAAGVNTNGVKVYGGRHIGGRDGTWPATCIFETN